MVKPASEPRIRIGLLTSSNPVRFSLRGEFSSSMPELVGEGSHRVVASAGLVVLDDFAGIPQVEFSPRSFSECRFAVEGIKIGIGFHWEREEVQEFQGKLILLAAGDSLIVINELPIESYLISVISSEMSASCPQALLCAHAIASRSWLLAQLQSPTTQDSRGDTSSPNSDPDELIRWYGRESHAQFDVCADDHCQRYQGISKAFSQAAFDAVNETSGLVLSYAGQICDTRYSKSCGGMTEIYSSVWEDQDVPYLKPIYDGPGTSAPGHRLPLSIEANAEDWITSSPVAYCATVTPELLHRILPGFDQETGACYRWRTDYSQHELTELLRNRLGIDFGRVKALIPVERGESGRIVKLKIVSENRTMVIGKELEIRRALSRSHLYSSAFVVHTTSDPSSEFPASFTLVGAGWGHGVGLCQIGAAVMADLRHTYQEILKHYFQGAMIEKLY